MEENINNQNIRKKFNCSARRRRQGMHTVQWKGQIDTNRDVYWFYVFVIFMFQLLLFRWFALVSQQQQKNSISNSHSIITQSVKCVWCWSTVWRQRRFNSFNIFFRFKKNTSVQLACYKCNTMTMAIVRCTEHLLKNNYQTNVNPFLPILHCSVCLRCVRLKNNANFQLHFDTQCDFRLDWINTHYCVQFVHFVCSIPFWNLFFVTLLHVFLVGFYLQFSQFRFFTKIGWRVICICHSDWTICHLA